MSALPRRTLYVTWQRPDRSIVTVGRLTQISTSAGTAFEFEYVKAAEGESDFPGLPGLPDLYSRHGSQTLFPVFANRLMPRDRVDYGNFVEELDLSVEADPFAVLGRSEGVRATDRIEVFPTPERSPDGRLTTLFFARGIRHLRGAGDVVDALHTGDTLTLEREPDNAVNPRAVLLNTDTGERVGWVPEYLLDLLDELAELNGEAPTIMVEHRNPGSVAPHLRLLCRARAPWPTGYQPFSGPEFQSLAPRDQGVGVSDEEDRRRDSV